NQERHHAYAGYRGLLTLAQEIDQALSSPIWEQVRRPAPWDLGGEREHSVPPMRLDPTDLDPATNPATDAAPEVM
ncbi:MAG: nitrogenase iron-molybdenum cofactor biosynthesis protein NifE, partial [Cyanobacteriota bacterium]